MDGRLHARGASRSGDRSRRGSDPAPSSVSIGPSAVLGLLGPTELTVNGDRARLGGVKQRAVLALLSLRPNSVVTLDELVDGVWDEGPPPSAVNTLQTYVSRVRRVLDGTGTFVVRSRAGGYSLDGDAERIDIHLFPRVAQSAGSSDPGTASRLLREALDLWRGTAFSDFVGWRFADPQATRLEELRLVVTEQSVAAELALGRHVNVVAELEVLVGLYPLREGLWSALMLALYRSGRQADALRAYQRVREALAEQLGILPGPALQQLERAILDQDRSIDWSPSSSAVPDGPGAVPVSGRTSREVLIGRRYEQECVDEWLGSAAGGAGQLVLVAGEAGIGKSALARHVMEQAASRGLAVACGRVWEEEGAPPFWPWIEVLRSLQGGRPGDGNGGGPGDGNGDGRREAVPARGASRDLEAFVRGPQRSGLQRASQDAAAIDRLRLFESVVADILDAARHRPLLIVVEDLHVADVASMHLLLFVARRIAPAPVLLLATYRPPDVGTAAFGHSLVQLMREPIARRLELGRLSDAEVAELLRLRLRSEVPADLLESIQRTAEGHPFFVTELVHLLVARNVDTGAFDADHFDVPRGVQHLVASRVAMISEQAAEILRASAVFGREVPLRVVQQITDASREAVAGALREGVAASLVSELAGPVPGYRFDHILVREALYQQVDPVDRRRLHERIALALESGAAGPPIEHVSEIAQHRVASLDERNSAATVEALRRAASDAVDHVAFEQGVQLYSVAVATLERSGRADPLLAQTMCELAEAEQRLGDVARARHHFLASADLARRRGDIVLIARIALGLGRGFEALMFDGELVALLEEALAGTPEQHVALRARLLARLAMAAYFEAGQRRERLSAEALRAARRTREPEVIAESLGARCFVLWGPAHARERLEMATSMLRLAEETGNDDLALDAQTWMTMEQLERGDRRSFDDSSARHARLASRHRNPLHRYYAEMWRGAVAALEGRYADAESCADRALELGSALTEVAYPRRCALLFAVRREQDRIDEVADAADRIVVGYPLLRLGWEPLRALVLAEMGDDGPAVRLLDDLLTTSDRLVARDANWMSAMVFLTEACELVGRAEHAGVLYERLTTHVERCAIVRFAPVCWGAVSRSLGTLARQCGDLAAAERHLADAIRRNEQLGAPTWAARSRFDLARVLLDRDAAGDRARALGLLDGAGLTAAQLGMTRLTRCVASARSGVPPSA